MSYTVFLGEMDKGVYACVGGGLWGGVGGVGGVIMEFDLSLLMIISTN